MVMQKCPFTRQTAVKICYFWFFLDPSIFNLLGIVLSPPIQKKKGIQSRSGHVRNLSQMSGRVVHQRRRRPRCGEDMRAFVMGAAAGGEGVCLLWQSPTLGGMVSPSCIVMWVSVSSATCSLKSPTDVDIFGRMIVILLGQGVEKFFNFTLTRAHIHACNVDWACYQGWSNRPGYGLVWGPICCIRDTVLFNLQVGRISIQNCHATTMLVLLSSLFLHSCYSPIFHPLSITSSILNSNILLQTIYITSIWFMETLCAAYGLRWAQKSYIDAFTTQLTAPGLSPRCGPCGGQQL